MDPKNLKKQFWGPAFWTILHTFAECILTTKNTILSNDEAEGWIHLLKNQQHVMPCALCSKHYSDWLKQHNFTSIRTLKNEERADWIQIRLYELHQHVNTLNSTLNITREELKYEYPRRRLDDEYALCCEMFKLALERHLLKPDDIHRWKTSFLRLRALYGV
jgi:hypothetical protein